MFFFLPNLFAIDYEKKDQIKKIKTIGNRVVN